MKGTGCFQILIARPIANHILTVSVDMCSPISPTQITSIDTMSIPRRETWCADRSGKTAQYYPSLEAREVG